MLEHPAPGKLSADAALAQLSSDPGNDELRERTARLLAGEARHEQAIEVLERGFIRFNAHDPGDLPCLCKTCMVAGEHVTRALGISFTRDFVVAHRRVLFYWLPEDLMSRQRRVQRSVYSSLRSRVGG